MSSSTAASKAALRKEIKVVLKAMKPETVAAASQALAERLIGSSIFKEGSVVSVYLSMPKEAQTARLVEELFRQGKRVYIPKVVGPESRDMRMFPLHSLEEARSFPLTKWNIPEPPLEVVMGREDGAESGALDLIITPGCAFDAACNRLGHGRGYYDSFFERALKACADKGRPRPVTVGLCLDEQVVASVPVLPKDIPLDHVVTPTRTYSRASADS